MGLLFGEQLRQIFQDWLGLVADDSTAECGGCELDRYNPKLDL